MSGLPGMDGLQLAHEVARRLAATDARLLNTVLISGDTDPAQLTRIAASGLKCWPSRFTWKSCSMRSCDAFRPA